MTQIPKHGQSPDAILSELAARAANDVDWRGGRVWSLVYHAGAEHEQLMQRAHAAYASANLLNPMAFKGLKQLESELVEMAGRLFHCSGAVGTVTSGGTESILCAIASGRGSAGRSSSCRPRSIRRSTRPRTTWASSS